MLSLSTFIAAEKLRQSLSDRHFGHFDRDASFLHGTWEDETAQIAAVTVAHGDAEGARTTGNLYLTCEIVTDPTSGNQIPRITPS